MSVLWSKPEPREPQQQEQMGKKGKHEGEQPPEKADTGRCGKVCAHLHVVPREGEWTSCGS